MKLTLVLRVFLIVLLLTIIVGALSRWGTNVNGANGAGSTLLHAAARDGDAGVARLLLGQGADVNATSKAGETALDVAERTGHTKVADILRDAGGTHGG